MARLLDLYCGAGGASVGYRRAGFDVVGIDIAKQPRYPYEFVCGNALNMLQALLDEHSYQGHWLRDFDAIHASPPCQAFTTMSVRHRGRGGVADTRMDLLAPTRALLEMTELPWIIENVRGAKRAMRDPITLTGEQFGLGVHRPRLFESNMPLVAPPKQPRQKDAAAVYGKNDGRLLWRRTDGSELHVANLETGSAAMGIDWMEWHELTEAIPPAYTEYLGRQLLGVRV